MGGDGDDDMEGDHHRGQEGCGAILSRRRG